MRDQQLLARAKKRRKQTTRQGKGRWRAPDPIGRQFATDQLDRKWYGDGTEIITDQGKRYLDSVLDMGSRRIAGFALGEHHDAELAYDALARQGHHAGRGAAAPHGVARTRLVAA